MAVQVMHGVDPTDKRIIEQMRAEGERIEAENRPPETLVEKGDLSDADTLGGLPCRPLSAGVLAILEHIKSPLIVGGDEEAQTEAVLVALFVLLDLKRTNEELVDLAWSGADALKKDALAWSFTLPFGEVARLSQAFAAKFAEVGKSMEIYSGGSDGEKKTMNPQIG